MENLIHVFNALELNQYFTSNDYKTAYSTLNDNHSLASCTLYSFLKRLTTGGFVSSEEIALPKRGPRLRFKKLKDISNSEFWMFRGSQAKVEHKLAIASKKEIEAYSLCEVVEMDSEDYEKFKLEVLTLREENKSIKKTNSEMMDEVQTLQTENRILKKRLEGSRIKADMSFLDEEGG